MRGQALSKVMLIAAIAMILTSTDLRSESSRILAGGGFGPCSLGFASAHWNVSIRNEWLVVSFRQTSAEGAFLFFRGTRYFLDETALMIGMVTRDEHVTFSLEAGAGLLDGHTTTSAGGFSPSKRTELSNTTGLALGSQFVFTPWKYVGLGLYAYMNINEHKNYGGVHFTVYLGQMRN